MTEAIKPIFFSTALPQGTGAPEDADAHAPAHHLDALGNDPFGAPEADGFSDPAPQPVINWAAASKGSGMWQVYESSKTNADAINNLDANGLIALSAGVNMSSEAWQHNFLEIMSAPDNPNSDYAKITAELASTDDATQKSYKLQALNTIFNTHNGESNDSSTFYSNTNNGINQNSSDTQQTANYDYTNMGQVMQQIMTTITNML